MRHSRRHFMRTGLGACALVSLAPGVPRFLARAGASAGRARRDDTILVVLQLSGGNDGLNTIIPFADDAYARSRPTLRWTGDQVLKLTDELGLHPRLEAFRRLHDAGRLAVMQGVGCPRLSRDHDDAMRAWHVADPDPDSRETGWAGRAADALSGLPSTGESPALFVGSIPRPFSLNAARAVVPSVEAVESLRLPSGMSGEASRLPAGPERRVNPLIEHVDRVSAIARNSDGLIREAASGGGTHGGYPDFPLARDFRTVAQLIRAEVGVRIYFIELGGGGIGGFDNHANQAGNHDALLEQMATGMAAFVQDLARDGLLDRVLLMTFSEFGRTVAENGRRGTDHGAAAPVFLAGGGVRGGLHGVHPSLTELDQGALKHHVDFRELYATTLETWLGLDAATILGDAFPTLDLWAT
ncbi:MAG: DUF1501 domain-containing protein [Verrucomicrobiales bacterium]|nr:DUF1501 domain-containing protein [Verrucomicrobiales bacterium]MCP5526888.1 DUF1501 domain-containing protein [Verrucomicrobiales bacterium]